jgi:hypothetical protein
VRFIAAMTIAISKCFLRTVDYVPSQAPRIVASNRARLFPSVAIGSDSPNKARTQ